MYIVRPTRWVVGVSVLVSTCPCVQPQMGVVSASIVEPSLMLLRNFDLAVQHEGVLIVQCVRTYVEYLRTYNSLHQDTSYIVVTCLSMYIRTYAAVDTVRLLHVRTYSEYSLIRHRFIRQTL